MRNGITQSGGSEEGHWQGRPWRNRDSGRQQDVTRSNCGASASVADTGMVKVQRDDGGEGTRSYQVQQIEAASDWFLACTRGGWGPDSSPLLPPSSLLDQAPYRSSNISFLSPAIFSQVLSSSLCLAYATIPPPRWRFTSQLLP